MNESDKKVCLTCKQTLTMDFFYRKNTQKPATRKSDWTSRCIDCEKKNKRWLHKKSMQTEEGRAAIKKYKREYYLKNRERVLQQQQNKRIRNHPLYLKRAEDKRSAMSKNIEKLMRYRELHDLKKASEVNAYLMNRLVMWRASAKRRHLSFTITHEDIISLYQSSGFVCYYTGEPLTMESNKRNTLSLDRVDSCKGYSVSNVVFCSNLVNKMKLDLSISEFEQVLEKLIHNKLAWNKHSVVRPIESGSSPDIILPHYALP